MKFSDYGEKNQFTFDRPTKNMIEIVQTVHVILKTYAHVAQQLHLSCASSILFLFVFGVDQILAGVKCKHTKFIVLIAR